MNFLKQPIRLSLFFFFLLFLSGRIGLFLHEFMGHALCRHLFDGELADFSLFIFGGGRVHYGYTPAATSLSFFPLLAVDLSGVTVELASGVIFFIAAVFFKTNRPLRGLFVAASSVLIVHSPFYFTISTYYGSGDGRLLLDVLNGEARRAFLLLAFSLTAAGAFIVSYAFSPQIISWAARGSIKKRALTVVLCAFSAGVLHGALTIGEQAVLKDAVYAELKTPKNVRLMSKELSEFIETYTKKHGEKPKSQEIEVVKNKLEHKYRQFPIEIALGAAILVAFAVGFTFSKRKNNTEPDPVSWKDIRLLGCLSVMAAVLILVLNKL